MIRKQLEKEGYRLTDAEFAVVMEITTDDIKFNQLSFKKRTTAKDIIKIACRCAQVFLKCA